MEPKGEEEAGMRRLTVILSLVVVAAVVAGCGPAAVVENRTGFAVRAIVTTNDGGFEVLSPSPGESSIADVSEFAYRVSVTPDQDWINHAKLTRQYLNDRLANAANLSGPQLLEVIQRLKDIAAQMKQFKSAGGTSPGCTATISSGGNGNAVISTDPNGGLVVACH
jgi:hypothetical protein